MPDELVVLNQGPTRSILVRAKCQNCGKIHEFPVPRHKFDRLGRGGRAGEQLSEIGAGQLNLLLGKPCGCQGVS